MRLPEINFVAFDIIDYIFTYFLSLQGSVDKESFTVQL